MNNFSFEIRTDLNEKNGLYINDERKFSFRTIDDLKNPEYNLYVYTEIINKKLYFKLGKADKTVYARYGNNTGHTACQRMIALYHIDKQGNESVDKVFHDILQRYKNLNFRHAENEELNTEEAYEIESEDGIANFFQIIEENINIKNKICKKNHRPVYEDISNLVNEIINHKLNYEHFLLNLCPRWGKTRTTLELFKEFNKIDNTQILIMCSYVGTVRTSYIDEIQNETDYESIKFVDLDKITESFNDIRNWLDEDSNHKIFCYLALTGSGEKEDDEDFNSCFKRRTTELIKNLKTYKSMMFVEEADFGAHCINQIKKIKTLYKAMSCQKFFGMTGTNANYIRKIFQDCREITKDYIIDVLCSSYSARKNNAVGINWNVLHNYGLLDKIFNLKDNNFENFSDIFSIDEFTKRPKGEHWLRELFYFIFNNTTEKLDKETNIELSSKIKNFNLLELTPGYATYIWTKCEKENHEYLKNLIEERWGTRFIVQVINGDETSNKDAERLAKIRMEEAKKIKKHVIFIGAAMANRSFSVKEIKNIVLLSNGFGYSSLIQKIARAWTPMNGKNSCNILDFRLNQYDSNLDDWCDEISLQAIDGKLKNGHNPTEYAKIIAASPKISFNIYNAYGITPFKKLTEDEIVVMMRSGKQASLRMTDNSFMKNFKQNHYQEPKITFGIENQRNLPMTKVENKNIKGDTDKKKKISNFDKNNEAAENEEQKLSNIEKTYYFIKNNARWFDSCRYDKDILFNEINHMSKERIKCYEEDIGIDMTLVKDIINDLYKDNCPLDKLLKI